MKNRTVRKSLIAPYIDGLLEEKHANGYSYESEELVLNRFDTYCINKKLETPEITKAFLSDWMERSETEKFPSIMANGFPVYDNFLYLWLHAESMYIFPMIFAISKGLCLIYLKQRNLSVFFQK